MIDFEYETFETDVEDRFNSAFEFFCDHLSTGGSHTLDESRRELHESRILRKIAPLSDGEDISDYYDEQHADRRFPFEVLALNEDELREAMSCWGYAVGLQPEQWARHEDFMEKQLSHEAEHTAAIRDLGITVVHYGLELLGSGDQGNDQTFLCKRSA